MSGVKLKKILERTVTGISPICQLCGYVRVWRPRLISRYVSVRMRKEGETKIRHFCKNSKSERCHEEVSFNEPCRHFMYNLFNTFERHSVTGILRTKEELDRLFMEA